MSMDKTFGLLDIDDDSEPIVKNLEADGQHYLDNTEQMSSSLASPVTKKKLEKNKISLFCCLDSLGNEILSDNALLSLINLKDCSLSKQNIEKLKKIVLKHKLVFHEYDGKIGRYKGKKMLTIRLKDKDSLPKPIRAQQLTRGKEAEIEQQIKQMINKDLIESSRIDFRRINSLIEAQSHHIPRIQNFLNEAAGKRLYSTFDLKSGFHQIALDASSRKLASFVTHQGIFSYKVMPMGLTGSPDAFQRIMETVLFGLTNTFVYIDDILTASDNELEHLENIEAILKRIEENDVKISLKKSSFGLFQINYLGYTIDFHGIKPHKDKILALANKKSPTTAKEVKSFIRAASYFRRHIANFAHNAKPLYRISNEFKWTNEQVTAFNNIKIALINAACLKKPDSQGTYEIHTDASTQGIGAK
uniref:Reverse transcriptase domain-containing protein n=1 Tax=Strongyloides venezuelensis TaxID=75913 RepID=A0A0K0G393_STRVS